MPIKTRLTTKGFDEYLERLARAGKDIDAIADEMLAAGGEVLLAGMEERVPVGQAPEDPHPGNLKNHLSVSGPHQDGNLHYIDVGLNDVDPETARYGNVQEFGSARTPAQPYIRPTMDHDMGRARAAMRKVAEEKEAI